MKCAIQFTREIKLLLNEVGFDTDTFARANLGHGIDLEGISKGMEMLKKLN